MSSSIALDMSLAMFGYAESRLYLCCCSMGSGNLTSVPSWNRSFGYVFIMNLRSLLTVSASMSGNSLFADTSPGSFAPACAKNFLMLGILSGSSANALSCLANSRNRLCMSHSELFTGVAVRSRSCF